MPIGDYSYTEQALRRLMIFRFYFRMQVHETRKMSNTCEISGKAYPSHGSNSGVILVSSANVSIYVSRCKSERSV